MKLLIKIGVALSAATLMYVNAEACTATRVTAKDGSVIYARTLEFGVDIKSNVIMIPRNYAFQGTSPFEGKGLSWKSKYAVVGANAEGQKIIVDGVNEKGLAVGSFYFPGYADYQAVNEAQADKALNSVELGGWLLTNYASVDEVKAALSTIKVSNAKFKAWGFVAPMHYIVTEASGKSLVIEYVKGKMHLYDNKLGAFTNAPTFNWHMTNLKNYVNLSPLNVTEIKVDNDTLSQFGEGSGMHGLPGDFTPPSRFVRSAVFTATSVPVDNREKGIAQAFHILNNFDIPKGSVVAKDKEKDLAEYTLWTSATDLQKKRFYFHTFDNRDIKMVDLMAFDLNAKEIKVIPMAGTTSINDVSKSATDMQ